ncbi:MAG TPA: PKD domain-containing protein [Thermoanaerobaculia bacterium]|nr:PKD domain-containing protein [Thermoanaerobaculia bacterium]
MYCRRFLAFAFAACLATACDSTNPVEPPPGGSIPSDSLTVSVLSDQSRLEANSAQGATLSVSARKQDGSPAADGTEIVLNTNLGSFGTDDLGKPVQLVKKPLTGGAATVSFFAGAETGTANILAQVGTSVGKLNLAIVAASAPPVPPVADFMFEVSALSVLFADTSMGAPTAWSWDFGDGDGTNRQNPKHTYRAAGTYTASLTVTSAGGESTKRKFVTVEAGDPLLADFTYTANGLAVLFADASIGEPVSWLWNFGDGTRSTARNPSHTYARVGSYAVKLTIANAFGVSDDTSQFISLSLGDGPVADFLFQADGLSVLFTDKSTGRPTSWSWSFGDNTTSTEQSPSHSYAQPGTYNVTLTATNAAGSSAKSTFVTVSRGEAPKADFQVQTDGLRALFTDASTGGQPTSWSWSFGDGSTSTAQSPEHAYAQAGTYNVTLTATNDAGSSAKSKFVTVSLGTPPKADFQVQAVGLRAVFADSSTGTPTSWSWDFGDCASSPATCRSTEQNPTHNYAQTGTYTVSLTATNAAGSNRVSKLVTITSSNPPAANFCVRRNGLTVIFTDTSTGGPTAWQWNFGDCATSAATCQSTAQNPGHSYTQAGTYAVTLTAVNAAGQNTRSKFVTVDEVTVDAGCN